MLSDLIDERFILLNIDANNWQDAIMKSCEPFVNYGIVSQDYVQQIIHGVKQYGPYIVITKHIAIPHAPIQYGALKCAIGIVTLKQEIEFGNKDNDPVKYLFPLSANDNTTHLNALATLVELFEDESFFNLLDHTSSKHEVINYIKQFEEEILRS